MLSCIRIPLNIVLVKFKSKTTIGRELQGQVAGSLKLLDCSNVLQVLSNFFNDGLSQTMGARHSNNCSLLREDTGA